MRYRKLWKDTGSRYVKLEVSRDLNNAPDNLLNLHAQLIQLGDKYIAHPDQTAYEQSSLHLVIEGEKANLLSTRNDFYAEINSSDIKNVPFHSTGAIH